MRVGSVVDTLTFGLNVPKPVYYNKSEVHKAQVAMTMMHIGVR